LPGCSGQAAPGEERRLRLAGSTSEPDDGEEVGEFIALQRQLVAALATGDIDELASLLHVSARLYDLRTPAAAPTSGGSSDAPSLGYYEIMAGSLSGQLSGSFDEFAVVRSDAQTISFAFSRADAVRTSWQPLDGGWVASRIVITSSADGREQARAEQLTAP
jgi:hypothetical protein